MQGKGTVLITPQRLNFTSHPPDFEVFSFCHCSRVVSFNTGWHDELRFTFSCCNEDHTKRTWGGEGFCGWHVTCRVITVHHWRKPRQKLKARAWSRSQQRRLLLIDWLLLISSSCLYNLGERANQVIGACHQEASNARLETKHVWKENGPSTYSRLEETEGGFHGNSMDSRNKF